MHPDDALAALADAHARETSLEAEVARWDAALDARARALQASVRARKGGGEALARIVEAAYLVPNAATGLGPRLRVVVRLDDAVAPGSGWHVLVRALAAHGVGVELCRRQEHDEEQLALDASRPRRVSCLAGGGPVEPRKHGEQHERRSVRGAAQRHRPPLERRSKLLCFRVSFVRTERGRCGDG